MMAIELTQSSNRESGSSQNCRQVLAQQSRPLSSRAILLDPPHHPPPTTYLPFHTYHLAEGVDDFYEIGLRRHHRVNRLVGRRGLVDHVLILPALHAFRH